MAGSMVYQLDARHPAKDSEVQTIPTSAAASDAGIVFDRSSLREAALGRRLCQHIHDVIDGRNFFDKYAMAAVNMRVLSRSGLFKITFVKSDRTTKLL